MACLRAFSIIFSCVILVGCSYQGGGTNQDISQEPTYDENITPPVITSTIGIPSSEPVRFLTPTNLPELASGTPGSSDNLQPSPSPSIQPIKEVGNSQGFPSTLYFRSDWTIFQFDFLQMEAEKPYDEVTILYFSTYGKDAVFWDGEFLFIDQSRTGKATAILKVEELKNVWWLTSNKLIVQTGSGFIRHEAFIFDISTKTQTQLNPPTALIEAVSPAKEQWIQNVGHLELVDIQGNVTTILEDLHAVSRSGDTQDDHNIVFSPDGASIYFGGCISEEEKDCFLFKASVKENLVDEPQIIIPLSDIDIKNIQISPNDRFLAFISQHDAKLEIVDLDTNSIIHSMEWNEPYYPPDFIWSPFSDALAIQSVVEGNMIRVFFIFTNEWRTVHTAGTFYKLLSWEK